MDFMITFNLTGPQVSQIYSLNQYITLVQSVVTNPLATGNLPIAWFSFQPFESNVVTWNASYNLYASSSDVIAGATVSMSSQTSSPISPGMMYTFQDGVFSSAPGGSATTFNLTNGMSSPSLFGLSSPPTYNGNTGAPSPLCAVSVGASETATFTPEVEISIFLSEAQNNGVVLTQIAGNALVVPLSSQNPNAVVGFNATNNSFYIETASAATAPRSQRELASRLSLSR